MSVLDREALKALAADVFASIAGESPAAIRLLSRALGMADAPLSQFSLAFDYFADVVEFPDCTSDLCVLKLTYDLRHASVHPDAPALLDRLERAEGAPWRALHEALRQVWTADQLRRLDSNEGASGDR